MKKILILALFCVTSLFPQGGRKSNQIPPDFILSDIIYLPQDSAAVVYLTYRIPYNRLIFEKKQDIFEAAYRFALEVFDDKSKFTDRQIIEARVTTDDFDKTNSEYLFEQGFVKFNLAEGEYKVIPQFTDLKSSREIPLRKGNIKIKGSTNFYQPIIVQRSSKCGSGELHLVNYEGNIPFDGNEYEVLIPFRYTGGEYQAELSRNGFIVSTPSADVCSFNALQPVICEGKIFLDTLMRESRVRFLSIKPGRDLLEGDFQIRIFNKNQETLHTSTVTVKWYRKPQTLMNRAVAVRLLQYIDEEQSYSYIKEGDPSDFDSLFFNYWKKYDPTPSTAYNELMNEYYSRADYASMNFGAVSGKTGLDTDRGKIYIKFGKPLSVERRSTEKGKIIEVWLYSNERTFTFIDEKGTGEFNLLQG